MCRVLFLAYSPSWMILCSSSQERHLVGHLALRARVKHVGAQVVHSMGAAEEKGLEAEWADPAGQQLVAYLVSTTWI